MTIEALQKIDARLEAQGVHPLTVWWRPNLEALYETGKRRLVAEVGRGGVKSGTMAKLSCSETLGRTWPVPPGERHFFAFVSATKPEAAQRLTQIERYLQILGVAHARRGDAIELDHLPLGFRVFAAQVGAVSGFRCIGFACDELAKWKTAEGANPAEEVVASLRAMTITHPDAFEGFVSSPVGMDSFHHKLMEQGEDHRTMCLNAPSWVANPSITEEETRRREPDPRVWAREYAARPQHVVSAALDPEEVAAAIALFAHRGRASWRYLILDPAKRNGDDFAACEAGWERRPPMRERKMVAHPEFPENGPKIPAWEIVDPKSDPLDIRNQRPAFVETPAVDHLTISHIRGWDGAAAREGMDYDRIVDELAVFCRAHGIATVIADDYESAGLRALFAKRGIYDYRAYHWSNTSKSAAMATVRRLFRENKIAIQPHEKMHAQLLGLQEKILPSGLISYAGRPGKGVDDYACLLIAMAHGLNDDVIRGAPFRPEGINTGPKLTWTAQENYVSPGT